MYVISLYPITFQHASLEEEKWSAPIHEFNSRGFFGLGPCLMLPLCLISQSPRQTWLRFSTKHARWTLQSMSTQLADDSGDFGGECWWNLWIVPPFLVAGPGKATDGYGDFLSLKKVVFFGRGDGAERVQKHSFFWFRGARSVVVWMMDDAWTAGISFGSFG